MISYKKNRKLSYTRDQVMSVVFDIEKYPEFLPWYRSVQIIEKRVDGNLLVQATVQYKSINYSYKCLVKQGINKISVALIDENNGPLYHLKNSWSFKPNSKEKLELEFLVEVKFHSAFLELMAKIMAPSICSKAEKCFERRLAKLFG